MKSGESHSGLECVIGGERVVVPIEHTGQIVEYKVSPPPPLAHAWFAGLGIALGRVLPSVTLQSSSATSVRTAKGVLMQAAQTEWLLEVDVIGGIVEVVLAREAPTSRLLCPPSWLTRATTADGRALVWLDTQQIAHAVSGA
jgi:chemotaxis signal transduction protein